MLLQLYNYFENLFVRNLNDLQHLQFENVRGFKGAILLILSIVSSIGIWYVIQSFSSYSKLIIEFLSDRKNFGFSSLIGMITRSFGEIKFSLSLLIGILLAFNLVYNQYINRANGVLLDIIYIPLDNHVNDDINADLNMNDKQNVHNGAISKYVKEAVNKLIENEQKNFIQKQSLNQIHREIHQYLTDSLHPSAIIASDILDQIYNMNAFHTSTNLNEMEILRLVWQRIKNPVNIDVINDLKESLLVQLADCRQNGSIMCITGRITRILQTLECIDAENIVNLKPLWAIKENIAEYFSHYVNKLLNKVPQKYKIAFENIERSSQDVILVENFNRCLTKNLNNKFKLMYLDTLILNQKQLDELALEYFQNIENI